MFVTIINDCSDDNAKGRQTTRVSALFGSTPNFIGLAGSMNEAAQLEASGNIIDMLDASDGHEGVLLVNVAPRNGVEKVWGNGTPFCYTRIGKLLIVSTVSGLTLSLPHKLGLLEEVHVFDLDATAERMHESAAVTKDEYERIRKTQFRSLDFVPRVAHWLSEGGEPETTPLDLADIKDPGARVWTIDNFGNAKTTLLGSDIADKTSLTTAWGELPIVHSLKDVEDKAAAVTVGSSGYSDKRFVEIVIQGAHAAEALGIRKGDTVLA